MTYIVWLTQISGTLGPVEPSTFDSKYVTINEENLVSLRSNAESILELAQM